MPPIETTFRASRVFHALVLTLVGLVLLHVLGMLLFYRHAVGDEDWFAYTVSIVDLDEEESLGTWFSTMLLALCSVLLFMHRRRARQAGEKGLLGWTVLAWGFLLLSLDEVAGFHELGNTLLREGNPDSNLHWSHFGAGIALLCGVLYVPFLRRLPGRTAWLFLLAGVLYVGGAVAVEWGTIGYEERGELGTLGYNLWNALEEGLEMLGASVFVYALLDLAQAGRPALAVRIEPSDGAAEAR